MSVFSRFHPLGDRILVLPFKDDEKRGNIFIPPIKAPESQIPLRKGLVIAKSRMLKDIHQGDVILYERTAGFDVIITGAEAVYRCIRHCYIAATDDTEEVTGSIALL